MKVKEALRGALSSPLVARSLRAVNLMSWLGEDRRAAMYHMVTKKVVADSSIVFAHKVPGGRTIQVHLSGTIRRLYWTGEYETDALPLFAAYAARAQVILDVGAAEGIYTLFAAAANPRARIFAFEPGSVQYPSLLANLSANGPLTDGRVEAVEVALADHDGTATFYESGGTSSLNAAFRRGTEDRTIRVISGDELVRERLGDERVGLIKIDTESTEPAVLRGLTETVERDRPVIFCEVLRGRSEPELQELIDAWGYRTYWLSGTGAVRRSPVEGDPTYRYPNWLFLPDDREPLVAGGA